MLGHDAVAQALVDHGVDTVFGVLGDGNLFIGENLQRQHGVNLVGATHEANAVCMAEGWAKATGRLGVATVTHGPGLTNTITALVEGVKNETPMLLVAGDTPIENEQHLQNLDQHALVVATGAGFQPVRNVETIAEDISTAVRRAHAERRPVVVNVPLNIEWEEVEYEARPPLNAPASRLAPDPDQLETALGLIASSARPIILAGRGAVKSDARDALVRLGSARRTLATSLLGTGYFEGTIQSWDPRNTQPSNCRRDVRCGRLPNRLWCFPELFHDRLSDLVSGQTCRTCRSQRSTHRPARHR